MLKTIIEHFCEMWNEEYATGGSPAGHEPLMMKTGTVSEIQILLMVLGYVPYTKILSFLFCLVAFLWLTSCATKGLLSQCNPVIFCVLALLMYMCCVGYQQ
jgi:hypothetical protein